MIPRQKLDQILKRYETLETRMSSGGDLSSDEYVALSKEYSELSPVVERIRELDRISGEVADLHALIEEGDAEREMIDLATEELAAANEKLPSMESSLEILLLPRDEADDRSAILELRAGTGGDEAAIFAGDLFRMYQKYCESRGWRLEIISASAGDVGGYKEIIASVAGKGVFARLKFESGVHRVQRVPETESSGRIHTSAATVAVLPEAEDVDVDIDEKDLRVDVFRASGPGGQSVNTTDSAVRITHLPSGIVVQQQDEKSQHKNRAKAMKVLRARLYELERQRLFEERASDRKSQVGSGDRSERVRTYNFPQGRLTDHRVNLTLYKLDKIIEGEGLDEVIDALITQDQAERLAATHVEAG